MNRFFSKLGYGAEYYLTRHKMLFILHAAAMLAGVILGCIFESKTHNWCIKTDVFVEILMCGGFGAVFFKAVFPNLLLAAGAVALCLSDKIAWISFVLTFLRGLALGAVTYALFAVLGFLGFFYFLLFALLQMAICVFAVAFAHAICASVCYCGRNFEYMQLLILAGAVFLICLVQTVLFFLILRSLFIF